MFLHLSRLVHLVDVVENIWKEVMKQLVLYVHAKALYLEEELEL